MMRARSWLPLVALAMWMGATSAQSLEEKRFYLTPFVGWTKFDSERRFSSGQEFTDDVYFGGRLGARLGGPVWLDIAGGYTGTKDCLDCTESWAHISGNLMLSSSEQHAINPFVSIGGGAARTTHAIGPVENAGNLEAAAGFKLRLSESIGIRLEARNVLWVPKENWGKAHIDDIVVGAGLTIGFGGSAPDSDGDGVPDTRDNCANTPRGCQVDANGCPLDSDNDGVCNGLDKCPDTPSGARVDASGCPKDSDGDGVYDGIDQCPDTPSRCAVDARGCPIDSDGDGVCDALDTCANTPRGCAVDANGCPVDSDNDGVCNGLDKCPDTPAGTKVDGEGCTILEREKQLELELLNTGMIRLSNVNFDYDKATIRPEAHAVLDTVGRILTKWPGLRIEIGGHTDSRGSEAYNRRLSQRRALSVRGYLLAHFSQFKHTQITAQGFGESVPIAPNTTVEGMQTNRRVEFVVLNREILKRQP